jgi:hypothetical protein
MLRPTVQLASLPWNKAPIWGLWPDLYYCQRVAGLFLWGALSDERTVLSYTIAAGPRHHSHRVRVPWGLHPYFTVSDSRLLFSSPPTTRWTAVEVFDPPPPSQSRSYITTDGQSASLSWNKTPIWGLRHLYYCQTVAVFFLWGALSDVKTDLSLNFAAGPRQRSHFGVRILWDSWQ